MNEGTFRVYVLRDDLPKCLASCDDDSLGFTLRTLKDEGQIVDGDCVGILERYEGFTGKWLINPWPGTPFGTKT